MDEAGARLEAIRDGCVLNGLNRILRHFHGAGVAGATPATARELRRHLEPIAHAAERAGTTSQLFGEDNVIGCLQEDEAVVGQVRLLLEARFGRGGYTFRNISAASMLSTEGFVLVHGCIERVAEPSN